MGRCRSTQVPTYKRIAHTELSKHKYFMNFTTTRRLLPIFFALALCCAKLFTPPANAQDAPGDPTRADAEMEEVLRALRANEQQTDAPIREEISPSTEQISLAGLVVGGQQDPATASGTAIFRIGDSYLLAREGETVENGRKTYLVKNANAVLVLLEESGGEELVLRARKGEATSVGAEDLATVEMQEVPLHLVSRALTDETGIRIAVSTEARDTPVSLYLRDVTIAETLDSIVLTHRLYMSDIPEAEIVRLHTTEEYAQDASAFRDERTQVFTLKYPNARDVALSVRDLYGDRVQLSQRFDGQNRPGQYLSEDLQQRMERFDIIDARGQGFGVDASGGGQGAQRNQGGSGGLSGQGNRSLTNQMGQNAGRRGQGNALNDADRITSEDELSSEEIAALAAGDSRVIEQVLSQRSDIYVTVIDRLNKVMVRTRDDKTMDEISELIESIDVPTPLVLIEVKIMEVSLDRGLDTAFDWNFNSGEFSGRFAPGGPVTDGDLVFSYLNDTFQTQVRMLQRANKLTMLGKPMLLTANNEVSRLFIGEEVPLNRNFQGGQTIVSEGGPILAPSNTDIEFRPVGSTLLITPNINDDRTVSLRVLQEESRIVEGGADVLVPDAGGGFINRTIDTVASQTASGTFVARDRETIVIGGMITEKLISQRSQIPILGDIPGLGFLARNQGIGRERREIVLMLTPHIIKMPGEAEAISREIVGRNSFHPNAPDGQGELGTFVKPNVLTAEAEEFGQLDAIQESQRLRAEPVQLEEKPPTGEPKKRFRLFRRK